MPSPMAKWLLRLKPKSAFARGVGVLAGGTAAAQLLSVLAAPLLTRLYSPEDFGLLAVYASLLALIGVVSSLRYELAIPMPEDDAEAANVATLSLILIGISTLLTGGLVLPLRNTIAELLGTPAIASYLWLLPVGVLLSGIYSVFNYWSVRTKRFTTIAGTKLAQALATIGIQLAAFKLGGIALLFGQVAGQGVGTGTLYRSALMSEGFRQVTWHGIAHVARRYRRFPIFLTWDGLLNTAGSQLPPLLFAAFFSPAAAGLYSLANRVLSLPASVIGNAVGQVFFSNAAAAYRAGNHGLLLDKFQRNLIQIGMPPALILIILGPNLFALIFGEQWRQAGEFARFMAPWLFLVFVYAPLSTLFAVMECQTQVLVLQIVLLILRLCALAIGAWIGQLSSAVLIFAATSAVCYLGFLFWIAHMTGNSASSLFWSILEAACITTALMTPILVASLLPDTSNAAWIGAGSITILLVLGRYWMLLRQAY
jgi:O-antigen/teichoic acid export membrane protein